MTDAVDKLSRKQNPAYVVPFFIFFYIIHRFQPYFHDAQKRSAKPKVVPDGPLQTLTDDQKKSSCFSKAVE